MSEHDIIRNQLVDGLRQAGAGAEISGQTADLAIHAAEEAIKAVYRVCTVLGGTEGMACGSIALQLLESLARTNGQELRAKMMAMPGTRSIEATIGHQVPAAAAAGSTQ